MINKIFSEALKKARTEMITKGLSEKDINSRLSDIGIGLLDELSSSFVDSLIENGKTSIREHGYKDEEFKSRLEFRWYKAFDLLGILIGCSLELIQEINDVDIKGDSTLYLLFKRLHARSIRIAKEILILIQNGYADGALARWRSLFEICTTVMFIDKYGAKSAQMYNEYQHIEKYNEMVEYNKRCTELGFEPISNSEVDEMIRKKEELESKYTIRFGYSYGWTCNVFDTGKLTFNRIVDDIGFELWKPYYKMACNSVHAGPKALFYNIGLSERQDILLVGPTNIGFVDPAQLTSISLVQITTFLVKNAPNYERLLVNNALNILATKVTEEFVRIQNEIDNEENEKNRLTTAST